MGGRALATNRIRDLRIERHLTQEALAMLVGEDTSIATISRLESGRMTLTQPWMERIAAALGVSPHDIIAQSGSGLRMVPLIGEIAAGDWAVAMRDPLGWVPLVDKVGGPRAFALRPKGDSMNEVANEDAYVIFDPDQTALEDKKIYAVRNPEGEATFKRYREDPPRLEPMSSNPEHKPIMVGAEPFVVIARAIYVGREL
jgi:repressor LexA